MKRVWYSHRTPMVQLWIAMVCLHPVLSFHKHAIQELTVTHETSACRACNTFNSLGLIQLHLGCPLHFPEATHPVDTSQ